ncbi:MAG: hypothetical protein N2319_13700 [Candidatus Kapabacteria bacterium]|nr:hypothetical protein [Candidatus Kapabacteria bacterium]
MRGNKFILVIIAAVGLIQLSCGDSGLSSSEPIDIRQGIGIFFLTQGLPANYIMDLVKDDDFQTFFYLSLTHSTVKTGDLPPSECLAYALSYLDYPSKLKYLKFDEIEMENLTPLVFPTKFEMPVNWNRFKYQFGRKYLWELSMHGEDVYKDTIKATDDLQKFYVNIKDTVVSLSSPINLRWTKPSEQTNLWLSMIYNGLGADTMKKIAGFKIDDNGSYIINPGDLEKLGVKPIGKLTFKLYRFTKRVKDFGIGKRKVLFFTAGEASVYVHLKD